MSLQADLKTTIKAALVAQRSKTGNPESAVEQFATDLSTAISNMVKAAVEAQTFTHVPALSNSAGPVVGTIVTTATVNVT